jgi:uncharacterized membrane protein
MKEQNNTIIWIVFALLVLLLFGGFGMMGFGGFGHMRSYGSQTLCGNVGGIWCYWPNFGFIYMVLFWVILIALIIWLVKRLTEDKQKPRRGNGKKRR